MGVIYLSDWGDYVGYSCGSLVWFMICEIFVIVMVGLILWV